MNARNVLRVAISLHHWKVHMRLNQSVVLAGLAMGLMSSTSQAAIVNVSGNLQGNAFTASLDLNVVGNKAVSGTGTFTGYGLSNADLVLITTSTPGNLNTSASAPVGFGANDGINFLQLDQAYPISSNGLLFDVGTTTAAFGNFPLLAVYGNGDGTYGAAFTGMVDGTEYRVQSGLASVSLSTVPLPASAPMFGAALLGLAGFGYAAKRKKTAAA